MHQTLRFRKDLKNGKSKKIQSSSEKNLKNRNIGKSSKIGIFLVKSEDLATLVTSLYDTEKKIFSSNILTNILFLNVDYEYFRLSRVL